MKGVPHFLKVGFTKSVGISKLTKESMGLAKSVGQDECKSLEEKFEQYKTSIDLAWTSNWGGTKGSAGVGSSGDKKALGSKTYLFHVFLDVSFQIFLNPHDCPCQAVILAKDRAQEALGKLQELSTASMTLSNQLNGNKYAMPAVLNDLKKSAPSLQRRLVCADPV